MSDASSTAIQAYLSSLPAQRLILRAVDELRPLPSKDTSMSVGPMRYVEVVVVKNGARVVQRFEGASLETAKAHAQSAGHSVVEQWANIT